MSEAKHTELPWAALQIRGGYQIWDIGGNELVATFAGDCVNPEFVCQAVNNHDALVKELETAHAWIIELHPDISIAETMNFPGIKRMERTLAKAKE